MIDVGEMVEDLLVFSKYNKKYESLYTGDEAYIMSRHIRLE